MRDQYLPTRKSFSSIFRIHELTETSLFACGMSTPWMAPALTTMLRGGTQFKCIVCQISFNPVLTESSLLACIMYLNLSYFTGSSSAIYERGTNASFLEMASLSSLPFGIDDPPKGLKGNGIGDLRIDLYQGGKTAKLCKGALSPKSLPLYSGQQLQHTD